MDEVRRAFRPEFLNRLDEILLFRRLSRDDMTGIVAIRLTRLQALLAERKITLEVDDAARRWLADAGYDPVYGARPLKRVIQRELRAPSRPSCSRAHPGRRCGPRQRERARPLDRAAAARSGRRSRPPRRTIGPASAGSLPRATFEPARWVKQ